MLLSPLHKESTTAAIVSLRESEKQDFRSGARFVLAMHRLWKAQYHVRKAPVDPNTVGQILERGTPIFQGKQSKVHYEIFSGVCSQNNLNLSKLISAFTWNKTPCLKDKCVNSRTEV
jgi:hypothetical protein